MSGDVVSPHENAQSLVEKGFSDRNGARLLMSMYSGLSMDDALALMNDARPTCTEVLAGQSRLQKRPAVL